MALAFNPKITEILWNRDLTRQEKVGHIVSLCKFKPQREMETEDALKLFALLAWATNIPIPRNILISWDKENRVMKLSFEKRDYFNGGNKYFAAITAAKAVGARRFLSLSAERSPFWLLHFAHKVKDDTSEDRGEEKTKEVVEAPVPTPPPPTPIPPPRVVRNVRRREKPIYTEVPLEDDDE